MKTIVSITPLPIAADSRTFKIASSFARFGYHSIVIEGEKSNLNPADLLFELRSTGSGPLAKDRTVTTRRNVCSERRHNLHGQLIKKRNRLPESVRKPLRRLMFLPWYWYCYFGPRGVIPKASLYYLHAPYQFPAVYWFSRRYATPFIYDAHDFYPVVSPNTFYKGLERWCIRKASAVVTVSEGIARLMGQEFGCQAVVLRNCHDSRMEREPPQGLREMLGLSSDTFLLVSVGQAKVGQAVVEALEALAVLPTSIHLALVGKNTEQYQEMVEATGLQSRVHLVPPVKPDEVVPFIRSADASIILYYPFSVNYEHCLPNRFFQSVSAELPLLYPELPDIKRLAEQYGLGIPIDPRSPESIQAAVMHMLNNTDTLAKHRQSLHSARKVLGWEQEEIIVQELVAGILKENPKAVG